MWRPVWEGTGGQCVMTCGMARMLKWSAEHWDLKQMVWFIKQVCSAVANSPMQTQVLLQLPGPTLVLVQGP